MFRATFGRLHNDEQGMEALQAVLVMAIAAVILTFIKSKWPQIKGFFNNKVAEMVAFDG